MIEEIALTAKLTVRELEEHTGFIINAFDRQHNIVFWNNKCAAHFGIPKEKALGKKLETVLPWVQTDEKLSFIDRALMGKEMQIFRVPYRMKKGWYEQRVVPVKDQDGKIIAALNFVCEVEESLVQA